MLLLLFLTGPGHTHDHPRAGSAAAFPKPSGNHARLPTSPLPHRRMRNRMGRTDTRKGAWARGSLGKSESALKPRSSWGWNGSLGRRRCAGQNSQKLPRQSLEGRRSRGLTGIHDDVPPARNCCPVQSVDCSESTLEAIADNSFPEPGWRGDSQAALRQTVWPEKDRA
jgi:hypothetical protein